MNRAYGLGYETPVNPETGLPLPLRPSDYDEADHWHHAIHGDNQLLTQTPAGEAMREVRLQWVYDDDYHWYYGGPNIAQTSQEQFNVVLWGTAGHVGDESISFHLGPERPRNYTVTPEMRTRLHEHDLRVGFIPTIQRFVRKHLLEQDLSHIDQRIIDEFVTSYNTDVREKLGDWLVSRAVEVATIDLGSAWKRAHSNGYLIRYYPDRPSSFVERYLIKQEDRLSMARDLRYRFRDEQRERALQTGVNRLRYAA